MEGSFVKGIPYSIRKSLLSAGLVLAMIACFCARASAHFQIEWEVLSAGAHSEDRPLLSSYDDHNAEAGVGMTLFEDSEASPVVFMRQYVSLMESFEVTFRIPEYTEGDSLYIILPTEKRRLEEGDRDNDGIILRFMPRADSALVDGHFQFGEALSGHAAPHDYEVHTRLDETINRVSVQSEDAWFKIYINEDLVSEIRKDDLVFDQNRCYLGFYSDAAQDNPMEAVVYRVNGVSVSHGHDGEGITYYQDEYVPFDNQPVAPAERLGPGSLPVVILAAAFALAGIMIAYYGPLWDPIRKRLDKNQL